MTLIHKNYQACKLELPRLRAPRGGWGCACADQLLYWGPFLLRWPAGENTWDRVHLVELFKPPGTKAPSYEYWMLVWRGWPIPYCNADYRQAIPGEAT